MNMYVQAALFVKLRNWKQAAKWLNGGTCILQSTIWGEKKQTKSHDDLNESHITCTSWAKQSQSFTVNDYFYKSWNDQIFKKWKQISNCQGWGYTQEDIGEDRKGVSKVNSYTCSDVITQCRHNHGVIIGSCIWTRTSVYTLTGKSSKMDGLCLCQHPGMMLFYSL